MDRIQTPNPDVFKERYQIGQDKLWYIMVILACTCFHLHLNLKRLSVKGFAVGCMKRQFPSIASDDTKHCDGLLSGNYFLSCNVCVTAGTFNCHNKCTWMYIFVHHAALQPEKKHIWSQLAVTTVCSSCFLGTKK